jgi:hypothetical protein
MWKNFNELGWMIFDYDKDIYCWARTARKAIGSSFYEGHRNDLRCGETWFAGVNFLSNDGRGTYRGVPLSGTSINHICDRFGQCFEKWDQAQISICYPGYPKPSQDESAAIVNYRKNKFGAHVDGILPVGATRRRFAKEYYAFILGIPLSKFNKHAAPLIVWEKSHFIMQDFLSNYYSSFPKTDKEAVDITEVYQLARKKIFETCKKKAVWAKVGEAYLLNRLTLHGIRPWTSRGRAETCGRIIAYFRPSLLADKLWLSNKL